MRNLFLFTIAASALIAAAPAYAADLPMAPPTAPAPVYSSWTSCHVGVQGGWGWGRLAETQGDRGRSSRRSAFGVITTANGAVFGGQAGCDLQFSGNWVIGAEGMFSGANINGSTTVTTNESVGVKSDWLASATARLGFIGVAPQTLVYVKGGAAWVHDRFDVPDLNLNTQDSFSRNRTGWTLGAGVEWAFAKDWSVFAEYDYYNFGGTGVESTYDFTYGKQTIQTVKAGLNFRFGSS